MLGGYHFTRNLDAMGVLELGIALQPIDLVLFEQEFDAAGQLLNGSRLFALKCGEVEFNLAGLDAEFGERAVGGLVKQLAAVQQGF